MAKRRRYVADGSDDDVSESGSDDSFIVKSSDEGEEDEGEGEEGDSDEERGETSDEESVEEDAYVPKEEMRKMYKKNKRIGEIPGYVDSLEHQTQKNPEELWAYITSILGTEEGVKKYGVVAKQNGAYRVVERIKFGNRYKWNKQHCTGMYEQILVPLVEKLFCQKAYQPPPDGEGIPKYAFQGWEMLTYGDMREMHMRNLWCICCQTNLNFGERRLDQIQLMRHKKSGIIMLTGGDCASNIMAIENRRDAESTCVSCRTVEPEDTFMKVLITGRPG